MNVKLNWVCVCVCMCKLPLNAESVNDCEVEQSVYVYKIPLNGESVNDCEVKLSVCVCVSYPLTLSAVLMNVK